MAHLLTIRGQSTYSFNKHSSNNVLNLCTSVVNKYFGNNHRERRDIQYRWVNLYIRLTNSGSDSNFGLKS